MLERAASAYVSAAIEYEVEEIEFDWYEKAKKFEYKKFKEDYKLMKKKGTPHEALCFARLSM